MLCTIILGTKLESFFSSDQTGAYCIKGGRFPSGVTDCLNSDSSGRKL